MDIAATSTEYIHIPVTATADGDPINLADPPRIAFLPGNGNPEADDWHDGEWADGNARILIGPEGGAIELDPGSYWPWVTWTAGDETPVYRTTRIRVI